VLHDGLGVLTGRQDVDVAYRLLPTPIAARHFELDDARGLTQRSQQRLHHLVGVRQQEALGAPFKLFKSAAQVSRTLLAESRQCLDPSGVDRRCELGHGGNAKCVIERPRSFRTEMVQLHQLS
jgi:hypothetical protein